LSAAGDALSLQYWNRRQVVVTVTSEDGTLIAYTDDQSEA